MFTENKIKGKHIYKLQYLGETVAICSRKILGRWEIKSVVFNFSISAKTKHEAICLFEEQYKLFLIGERV
ncbi:hypothetical protein IIU_06958 [Bacillus cereus VD133]|uniref:Uncharacterized protein n=1 Tax=Bacillus cereus VD133 TaxID=1053233 RepID=A0A9W5PJ75_BACCE|nr:hypothetical protein [Bacillus cereus]EOO23552.1 hypothetical protein IIU_06958 [Bacillus cereus VD133]